MSIRNIISSPPRYILDLPNDDLLAMFETLTLPELALAREISTRFRAIAIKVVKTMYPAIDLCDYLQNHYEDRISIFEAFGDIFTSIAMKYTTDSQLHMKLIRDYSRKTVKSLRVVLADLTCIDDKWTEPFDELADLTISDCEARLENVTKLLSLCPKLKRFIIFWTNIVLVKGRTKIKQAAEYYQREDTGGCPGEKLTEFMDDNQKAKGFQLCAPRRDTCTELHRYKFSWKKGKKKEEGTDAKKGDASSDVKNEETPADVKKEPEAEKASEEKKAPES